MKVELAEQVATFVRSQAPGPRRALRLGLRKLAMERGDIKTLEGPLKGYQRLRVGPYRIVFVYLNEPGAKRAIRCLFAERRDTVYTIFSRMLERQLLRILTDEGAMNVPRLRELCSHGRTASD